MVTNKYNASKNLLAQAQVKIPAFTQTFSKGPQVYGFDGVPHYITKSNGVMAIDADGNKYIDYSMGVGSVLLGHADPRINAAIVEQLASGNSHSLSHPLELEVADKVLELCSWADMVRFGKNGSDAMSAAIRLARAITNRDCIAVATGYGPGSPHAYHGWNDWSATLSTMTNGIPEVVRELTITFRYNNSESLIALFNKHGSRISSVVLEGAKFTPPSSEFVHTLNSISQQYGSLLIIDEIANGLRLSPGGAHERFGITPDLVAFGKSFANGAPLSILIGKYKNMKHFENVLFTLTYGGETLGLAAAKEVIHIYQQEKIFNKIETVGNKLLTALTNLVKSLALSQNVKIEGFPARFIIYPIKSGGKRDERKSAMLRKLLADNNILCAGVHNIAAALEETHIKKTVEAYRSAFVLLYNL